MLKALAIAVGSAAVKSDTAERPAATQPATMQLEPSSVRLEATRWSELPGVVKQYEAMLDQGDGMERIFGYASIINDYAKDKKPQNSQSLDNERARLPGMEVAMNVLAAGEYEFRGTRGKYTDAAGKEKRFANVGIYAGLEPALKADGYADGVAITVGKEDRHGMLLDYIKRELGEPPPGIDLAKDLFSPEGAAKFAALKNTPKDEFGMYKFLIADVELANRQKKPAITVSTNEKSKFAAIGLTPMQTAQMILDGQGYRRTSGKSMVGGLALDYFKNSAIGVARKLNLHQPRLEAIDAAVEELAQVYSEAFKIFGGNLSGEQQYEQIKTLIERHSGLTEKGGIYSPYFYDGQNVNRRDPVSPEDRKRPENAMAHTALEKMRRIAEEQAAGKTQRS